LKEVLKLSTFHGPNWPCASSGNPINRNQNI